MPLSLSYSDAILTPFHLIVYFISFCCRDVDDEPSLELEALKPLASYSHTVNMVVSLPMDAVNLTPDATSMFR